MKRTTTKRKWDNITALLTPWILLLSFCLSPKANEWTERTADYAMISSADSTPTSTMPGSRDVLPDPSEPDAEPAVRTTTMPNVHSVVVLRIEEEVNRPGFTPRLEKPPQV